MSSKQSSKKASSSGEASEGNVPAPAVAGPVAGENYRGLRRVVITGAGTINALGHDVETTLNAFREGRCGITALNFRDVDRLSIQIGAQVHDWRPEDYFNRQQILLYDKFTQFTLLAAQTGRGAIGAELRWCAGAALGCHSGHGGRWPEYLG